MKKELIDIAIKFQHNLTSDEWKALCNAIREAKE
jgi:hypothetical protein